MSEPTWDTVVVVELKDGNLWRSPAMQAGLATAFLAQLKATPPVWGRALRVEKLGEQAAAAGPELLAYEGQPRDAKGRWGRGGGGSTVSAGGPLSADEARTRIEAAGLKAVGLEQARSKTSANGRRTQLFINRLPNPNHQGIQAPDRPIGT